MQVGTEEWVGGWAAIERPATPLVGELDEGDGKTEDRHWTTQEELWEAQPGDVQSVNIGLMDGGDYKLGLKRVLSLVSIEQCNAQSS